MEITLDKLLEALDEAKSKEKSPRRKRLAGETKTHSHVDRFIADSDIESGLDKVPTYVVFYLYKKIWQGITQNKKKNKIVFFRSFNKGFKTSRTGKQRYYLLNKKSFDLSREGILEAKHYDQEYKNRSKARKKSFRKAQELKKELKSKV